MEAIRDAPVLLLNPPVADTIDAEDMHMLACVEPFGLLRLGTYFRQRGCDLQLIDCLRDPLLGGKLRRHVRKRLPCGNPDEGVHKEIYHFGLDSEQLASRLRQLPREPDVIAVTSTFTWHGEPLDESLRVCRQVYPQARILLGGNYATLCPEQAEAGPADVVVRGDLGGARFLPTAIDLLPGPRHTDYLRMIKGCPFRCSYCITHLLNAGKVHTRMAEDVFAEMRAKMDQNGTRTFVFYDDYIAFQQARYLGHFLDLVIDGRPDVTLEFPLGFSAHLVTPTFADKMRRAGVEVITLALETISQRRNRTMMRPERIDDLIRAVDILKDHGFRGRKLRVFTLMGLPGQTLDEILRAILFLYELEAMPSLTTYTLTPGSADMNRYAGRVKWSSLDELGPGLWRFAHSGMRVRDLDLTYRYFHERYFPVQRILDSRTDDPVVTAMQEIVRRKQHLPENW